MAKYWVGGGSSVNWNATSPTNWSDVSEGPNDAAIPVSTDDVIFDGLGANANGQSTISATTTIHSLFIAPEFTGTITHNTILNVAGNITLGANYTVNGPGVNNQLSSSGNIPATIRGNGKYFPISFYISGSQIRTFADTWNGNLIQIGDNSVEILAPFNVYQLNSSASPTFIGTHGWTAQVLALFSQSTETIKLQEGLEYKITKSFISTRGKLGALATIVSSDAVNMAKLTLVPGATCNTKTAFIRIDASGGRAINTFDVSSSPPMITDCINIFTLRDLPRKTSASTF